MFIYLAAEVPPDRKSSFLTKWENVVCESQHALLKEFSKQVCIVISSIINHDPSIWIRAYRLVLVLRNQSGYCYQWKKLLQLKFQQIALSCAVLVEIQNRSSSYFLFLLFRCSVLFWMMRWIWNDNYILLVLWYITYTFCNYIKLFLWHEHDEVKISLLSKYVIVLFLFSKFTSCKHKNP